MKANYGPMEGDPAKLEAKAQLTYGPRRDATPAERERTLAELTRAVRYEDGGVFVSVVEGRNQAPMVMETEGPQSSRLEANRRGDGSSWNLRHCVARLVYVSGNELLLKDMERMQDNGE